MKFLCLAYGDEVEWKSLSESDKKEALAHDAVILNRGNLMSAVKPTVTSEIRPLWNLSGDGT